MKQNLIKICFLLPRERWRKHQQNKKTSKIKEKATREINETPKVENKEKTKIFKTINVISSKVDKQVFFDVVDKIQDEETQKNYLQNFKKFNSQG